MLTSEKKLHHIFEAALASHPDAIYISETAGSIKTYREIYDDALAWKELIQNQNLNPGSRVLIYTPKNHQSISLMIACSICKLIYVPVSTMNPLTRAQYIMDQITASLILTDAETAGEFREQGKILSEIKRDETIVLCRTGNIASEYDNSRAAFILFTSGSTGYPKGVVISHTAAITFAEWCCDEFKLQAQDIVASIAPFNFDLSIFDIYATANSAATVVLYSEDETKNALLLAQRLSKDEISFIYSTPSVLSALARYGKMHKYSYAKLKTVLFAGEVFHPDSFSELYQFWQGKEFANLYGPTETNVCTFYRLTGSETHNNAFPIGKPCPYAEVTIADDNISTITASNVKGEVLVSGKTLFEEYWNDPVKTAVSLLVNDNGKFYKTGDVAFKDGQGNFVYTGRKDRMFKKNGFRIEPLEIENVVAKMENVGSVAVLYVKESNQIVCFLESLNDASQDFHQQKAFCQKYLPPYMIPDQFIFLKEMPVTPSGKVDLQKLQNWT